MQQIHTLTNIYYIFHGIAVILKNENRDIANIFYYYAFSILLSKLRTKDNINAEKGKSTSNTTQKG